MKKDIKLDYLDVVELTSLEQNIIVGGGSVDFFYEMGRGVGRAISCFVNWLLMPRSSYGSLPSGYDSSYYGGAMGGRSSIL